MNFKKDPQPEQLAPLVAALNDEAGTHIFWVAHDGEVHVSLLAPGDWPANWAVENRANYKGRAESLLRDNGYAGPKAAQDKKWLRTLFIMLRNAWESPDDPAYSDEGY